MSIPVVLVLPGFLMVVLPFLVFMIETYQCEYPLQTKLVDYDHNIKNPIAVYYCYVGGRDLVHDHHFFKDGKLIL